jgi:hypothetical protein
MLLTKSTCSYLPPFPRRSSLPVLSSQHVPRQYQTERALCSLQDTPHTCSRDFYWCKWTILNMDDSHTETKNNHFKIVTGVIPHSPSDTIVKNSSPIQLRRNFPWSSFRRHWILCYKSSVKNSLNKPHQHHCNVSHHHGYQMDSYHNKIHL